MLRSQLTAETTWPTSVAPTRWLCSEPGHGQIVGREDRLNPDPEHLHPAHHRVMLDLVRGCQVVVTAHIGPPMVASLSHLGIQVLGAPTESVEGALEAYLRSQTGGPPLEILTFDPAEAHINARDHHELIQP